MSRPPVVLSRARRLGLGVLAAAALAACGVPEDPAPAAEFLVSAGDSAFWITTGAGPARVRRAPLWIVRHDERFLELYTTDDDRSHRQAVFIGQRLWARDVVAGDSVLLAADTSALALEADYARRTPWDPPARPDDEVTDAPSVEATSDLYPLEVVGPFLGIEVRTDVETADSARHRHEVRHGVVDLRRGRRVSLPDVVGAKVNQVVAAGEAAWRRARDSVRAEASEAGRAASEAFGDFPFDPSSFSLTVADGAPAVVFTVPGRGTRSGGYVLPLPPLSLGRPAWWTPKARAGLPTDSADTLRWPGDAYAVVAAPDSTGEAMRLSVHRPGRRPIALAHLPRPVRRLWRVDAAVLDTTTRAALGRAFNEAGRYGDDVRTARRLAPSPFVLVTRP